MPSSDYLGCHQWLCNFDAKRKKPANPQSGSQCGPPAPIEQGWEIMQSMSHMQPPILFLSPWDPLSFSAATTTNPEKREVCLHSLQCISKNKAMGPFSSKTEVSANFPLSLIFANFQVSKEGIRTSCGPSNDPWRSLSWPPLLNRCFMLALWLLMPQLP